MTAEPTEPSYEWYVEEEDREVGIFGPLVAHDCGADAPAEEHPGLAHEEEVAGRSGLVAGTRVFVCPCGAPFELIDNYLADDYEPHWFTEEDYLS